MDDDWLVDSSPLIVVVYWVQHFCFFALGTLSVTSEGD